MAPAGAALICTMSLTVIGANAVTAHAGVTPVQLGPGHASARSGVRCIGR
jgi:hypothetical protein